MPDDKISSPISPQKKIAILQGIQAKCTPLFVYIGGSVSYGTNNAESDLDIRGIYIEPKKELLGLHDNKGSISFKDDDTILYGLRKAANMLINCNPNILEMLGVEKEHVLFCNPLFNAIVDNYEAFISREKIYKAFNGYAHQQMRLIERKELKDDIKRLPKVMTHLIRLYAMATDILSMGTICTYRKQDLPLLLSIRNGDFIDKETHVTLPVFNSLVKHYVERFETAYKYSPLPPEPDMEMAEKIVIGIYENYYY